MPGPPSAPLGAGDVPFDQYHHNSEPAIDDLPPVSYVMTPEVRGCLLRMGNPMFCIRGLNHFV